MTLAIGFFDGVHLGHQAILASADAAITFFEHPAVVLAPSCAPRLIMDYAERVRAILATGVSEVRTLHFDAAIAAMEPAEFAAGHLGEPSGTVIRCGRDWRFGRGGRGDPDFLRSLGYTVVEVPYAEYRGERVSSTRIRAAIEEGRMEDAAAMLGRPYSVRGAVFPGKGEGRRLGFPTLNLRPGVYAAEALGGKAVANFGTAPTFGDRGWEEPVLEVHLLGYLRGERKFASPEELSAQIAEDIRNAERAPGGIRRSE